ncbi:MAG: hypothetical protein ABSH38_20305 [Verrucomicrobiota bacterium]
MSSTAKAICAVIAIALTAVIGFVFQWGWFWISWEIFGAILVSIGCIGEWMLLLSEEHSEHKNREKLFAIIVAIGVTMDVFGLIHAIPEALQLSRDVAEANERAERAEKEAQSFRVKADEMEAKMQPRRIRMEQRTNFIFLAQFIPKVPIKILIGQEGRDTEDFASDLRETLTMAGFTANADAGPWQINRDSTLFVTTHLENTNNADLLFFSYETNDLPDLITIWGQKLPNGFLMPTKVSTNEPQVYAAIKYCLEDIGIKCEWQRDTHYVHAGECLIYVIVK